MSTGADSSRPTLPRWATLEEIDSGSEENERNIRPIEEQVISGPIRRRIPRTPTFRRLREGCWLGRIYNEFEELPDYWGTFRIETRGRNDLRVRASGDFYEREGIIQWERVDICGEGPPRMPPRRPVGPGRCIDRIPRRIKGPKPDPGDGIPVFAREKYWRYFALDESIPSLVFGDEIVMPLRTWLWDRQADDWRSFDDYEAHLSWSDAPSGYPDPESFLSGHLEDRQGNEIYSMHIGWVSPRLRRGKVEIDSVGDVDPPRSNGDGFDWDSVGDDMIWRVDAEFSDSSVSEPSGDSWSEAELHQTMLDARDGGNLDTEWRYHLLAVNEVDTNPGRLLWGVMFDNQGTDSNDVPREGAAIAADETGPGQFATLDASDETYFHTAVHEIGHAAGLLHPQADGPTLISRTANIEDDPNFPNNIDWEFSGDSRRTLRHAPDSFVRPGGGMEFASNLPGALPADASEVSSADVSSTIELEAEPVTGTIPLGAPLRLELQLRNSSQREFVAPKRPDFDSGTLSGTVTGPGGVSRSFQTMLRELSDASTLEALAPEESRSHAVTLLRGADGPLFAAPGMHEIELTASWWVDGHRFHTRTTTQVLVTGVQSAKHAEAAKAVLSTPNTLVAMVVGGDHLDDAVEAFQTALESEVLRPHFDYLEARRRHKTPTAEPEDLAAVVAELDDSSVVSSREAAKLSEMAESAESELDRPPSAIAAAARPD